MRCLAKENDIKECGLDHTGGKCKVCPLLEEAYHYPLERVIKELLCSDSEGNGSNLVEEIFLEDAIYYLEEYREKLAREKTVKWLTRTRRVVLRDDGITYTE